MRCPVEEVEESVTREKEGLEIDGDWRFRVCRMSNLTSLWMRHCVVQWPRAVVSGDSVRKGSKGRDSELDYVIKSESRVQSRPT